MSIINFVPKKGLNPLFGIKLSPTFSKICESLKEIQSETVIKEALNINKNRVIALKEVEDSFGNNFQLLIVFDYIAKKDKPPINIPHTDEGYFNFPIYNLDYNTKIDIESMVENGVLRKN